MQAIGSSEYFYHVFVRGIDKPIKLSAVGGEKLQAYLTSDDVKQFVNIKGLDGIDRTIRTFTIDRVERFSPDKSRYKTVEELGLPQLVSGDERVWR